jgi:hypothetical protein
MPDAIVFAFNLVYLEFYGIHYGVVKLLDVCDSDL